MVRWGKPSSFRLDLRRNTNKNNTTAPTEKLKLKKSKKQKTNKKNQLHLALGETTKKLGRCYKNGSIISLQLI